MRTFIRHGLILGLTAAGLATAAPSSATSPIGSTIVINDPSLFLVCPAMTTAADCTDLDWTTSADADSCLAQQRGQCKPILQSKFNASFDAAAAKRKMYPAGDDSDAEKDPASTDPAKLHDGAYTSFDTKTITEGPSATSTYVGLLQSGSAALRTSGAAAPAATPQWALAAIPPGLITGVNLPVIGSCPDYVHQRYEDYEDFESAAEACSDSDCVVTEAFDGDNAIAKKTLKTMTGAKMPVQIPLATGVFPKNEFFVDGLDALVNDQLERAKTAKADTTQLTKLLARVQAGATYYGFGNATQTAGATKVFASEWDFHNAMRGPFKSVPLNERREIQRRRTRVEQSLKAYYRFMWEVVRRSGVDRVGKQLPAVGMQPGFGYTDPSPFQRWSDLGSSLSTINAINFGNLIGNGALLGNVGLIGNIGNVGVIGKIGNIGAIGKLKTLSARKVADSTTGYEPTEDVEPMTSDELAAAGDALEKMREDIVGLLLDELARADRGQKGCMDLSDTSCDWSSDEFAREFTTLFHGERNADQDRCMDVTEGDVPNASPLPPTYKTIGDATANEVTFADYLARTEAARAATEKQMANVPKYPGGVDNGDGSNPIFRERGQRLAEDKSLGNKKVFAVGYGYDLGWKLGPEPDDIGKGGNICALGAELKADFDVSAWMLNHQVKLVDFVQEAGVKREGKGDKRVSTAFVHSHFKIATKDIYEPYEKDKALRYEWHKVLGDKKIESTRYQTTVDIVVVPVTFAAWGELDTGIDFGVSVGANSGHCTSTSSLVGAQMTVTPFLKANAIGSAGVGVPGFEVGVRGKVTLFSAALPIKTDIGMTLNQDGTIGLGLNNSGELDLGALSGSMSVFAELLWKDWEYEIFKWKGLEYDIPLWSIHKNIPLTGSFGG